MVHFGKSDQSRVEINNHLFSLEAVPIGEDETTVESTTDTSTHATMVDVNDNESGTESGTMTTTSSDIQAEIAIKSSIEEVAVGDDGSASQDDSGRESNCDSEPSFELLSWLIRVIVASIGINIIQLVVVISQCFRVFHVLRTHMQDSGRITNH